MLGVIVTYLGLITTFVGGLSVLRPLGFLAIHSRAQALAVIASGLVVVIIGGLLPASEIRVTTACTHLDQFVPAWQFAEFHSIRIAAPREKVYLAIQQVTAEEILFFRTLIWIRRFGRTGPESVLNPPPNTPLLEVATKTAFIVLAEEPEHEIVLSALVARPRGWRPSGAKSPEWFKALAASRQPGFALAAMNFRLQDGMADEKAGNADSRAEPVASGAQTNKSKLGLLSGLRSNKTEATLLTTETRVYATGAPSRRRFARYWRVIYPGSSLIRIMWLRAIEKRATSA